MKRSYSITDTKTSRGVKNIFSVSLMMYSLIAIVLILITVLSSFKTKSDLVNNTLGFPRSFTIESYEQVLVHDKFWLYFINSTVVAVGGVVLLLFVSSMAGYGLSKFRFKGKDGLRSYFLLGLMFPIQLGILPLFVMLRALGLINNLFGLILLYAANMSFAVFVFVNFLKTVPDALIECARIDGASEFRIYWKIVLPLSRPVLSTVGLISFVTMWNDFYMPLVFLTKENVRTLTLGVYRYMNNFLENWHLVFAAVTVALIPVIVVFFLFSKQIIAGLTSGAVKE
ncbi:MAG: carbohydrate ABC transporter permease [Eubacteriales bacterium]|nr:carbohydrate ABC transporter permease [Eubacteriales bacterium]